MLPTACNSHARGVMLATSVSAVALKIQREASECGKVQRARAEFSAAPVVGVVGAEHQQQRERKGCQHEGRLQSVVKCHSALGDDVSILRPYTSFLFSKGSQLQTPHLQDVPLPMLHSHTP